MSPRYLPLYLILITALLLAGCGGNLPGTVPSATTTKAVMNDPITLDLTAKVTEIQGTVEIKNPDQADFSPASDDMTLQVQGQVRTGTDSRIRLDLSTGTIVRVAPESLFTLQTNEAQDGSLLTRLMLEAGRVWVILRGGRMDVETPSGVASVRGSYMSVWVDPLTINVSVTCLEGMCQAENPTAVLDMVAGEGASLYAWDAAGSVPPPPPELRYLSQEEIDQFLLINPEAGQVMNAVMATASALPPLAATPTNTPVAGCFTLTSPVNGSILPEAGPVTFTWDEQPGRYKFVITFTRPNGERISMISLANSFTKNMELLPDNGTYQWEVTAYDSALQPICVAGPWTFTKQGTAVPTPTSSPVPGNCVTLLAPANGSDFPGPARVDFTWSAYPGAYKYIITFKPPSTPAVSMLAWTPTHTRYIESFLEGGTYQWWVTVKDSNINDICTSQIFTFTKPAVILPEKTPTPGTGTSLFWNQNGPTGQQTTCSALFFSVSANNPANGMIKVIYSFNPVPNGNSDPHIMIGSTGAQYGAGTLSLPDDGKTYYWRFAIYDGAYTHDGNIYSFTCPTSGGGTGLYWNHNVSLSGCMVSASADTNYASGIKKFVLSTSSNPPESPYKVLTNTGGTSYAASFNITDFAGAIPTGTTFYWRFEVYDGVYILDSTIGSITTTQACP